MAAIFLTNICLVEYSGTQSHQNIKASDIKNRSLIWETIPKLSHFHRFKKKCTHCEKNFEITSGKMGRKVKVLFKRKSSVRLFDFSQRK